MFLLLGHHFLMLRFLPFHSQRSGATPNCWSSTTAGSLWTGSSCAVSRVAKQPQDVLSGKHVRWPLSWDGPWVNCALLDKTTRAQKSLPVQEDKTYQLGWHREKKSTLEKTTWQIKPNSWANWVMFSKIIAILTSATLLLHKEYIWSFYLIYI